MHSADTRATFMSASDKALPAGNKARVLPLDLWPAADRAAWNEACQPARRLQRGGVAGHFKPVTLDDHVRHYGSFLGFLDRHGLLRMDGPPAMNVTADNVDAYLTEIKNRLSPTTVNASICKLRRVAQLIAPGCDFGWLAEIGKELALVAYPRSKFDRLVSAELLVEAGPTLIHEAEHSKNLTKLARAIQVRNGLMMALLALCPIRRKNFTTLEIGRSFVKIHGKWWIVLSASETKEERADERPVDELLTPFIDRYVGQYRPTLKRSDNAPRALWLSSNKGTPITDKQVARVIRDTTLSTVGVAVSPHLFRTSGASTIATCIGENPHLASALLHHTHPNVTNAHYNRASSFTAGEHFRQIVRRYEKN
jgi:integrase